MDANKSTGKLPAVLVAIVQESCPCLPELPATLPEQKTYAKTNRRWEAAEFPSPRLQYCLVLMDRAGLKNNATAVASARLQIAQAISYFPYGTDHKASASKNR